MDCYWSESCIFTRIFRLPFLSRGLAGESKEDYTEDHEGRKEIGRKHGQAKVRSRVVILAAPEAVLTAGSPRLRPSRVWFAVVAAGSPRRLTGLPKGRRIAGETREKRPKKSKQCWSQPKFTKHSLPFLLSRFFACFAGNYSWWVFVSFAAFCATALPVRFHVRFAAATKSCIFSLSLPPFAFSIPLATSTA